MLICVGESKLGKILPKLVSNSLVKDRISLMIIVKIVSVGNFSKKANPSRLHLGTNLFRLILSSLDDRSSNDLS